MSVSATAIAVVIATVHRPEDLQHVLGTVLAAEPGPARVLVVDERGTAARAVSGLDTGRISWVRPLAPGLSAALNAGIAAADTELVAVTGDDCAVPPGWLARIAAAFDGESRTAIAFGTVRAGACDPEEGFVPGCVIERTERIERVDEVHRLSGTTACMVLRTSAWKALGGFDESLGLGARFRSGEDLDFALRALAAGYHVLQTPEIEVEHRTPVSWVERSTVIRRNWFGSGAAFAKSLKLTRLPTARALARLAGRWRSGGSGVAATYGVRPDRRAMLLGFGTGFLAGLAHPVDRRSKLFAARGARVT